MYHLKSFSGSSVLIKSYSQLNLYNIEEEAQGKTCNYTSNYIPIIYPNLNVKEGRLKRGSIIEMGIIFLGNVDYCRALEFE